MTARDVAEQQPPPTWLEWGVRIVSLAIVGALVAFVVVDGLRATRPPAYSYEVDPARIERRGESWVVPAEITNDGTVSVSAVTITMALTGPDGTVVDDSSVTVDLLGRGVTTQLEFVFPTDPRDYEIDLAVAGYQLP